MTGVTSAFSRALGQLHDPQILRILLKSVLITLAIFSAVGAALWYGLYHNLLAQGVGYSAELGAVLAIALTIIGGWLLFRITALAVIQFFADEIVQAVERKHYPEHVGLARKLGFAEELANSGRSAGRALLVNAAALLVAIPLFFTAIGPAIVFWIANSWLLGRELQDIIWLRHRASADDPPPLGALQRLILGGIVTALLAIPVANLLAPVLGTASAAHLVHSKLHRIQRHG